MLVRITQLFFLLAASGVAQTFDSGSDGTDGAFVLPADAGVVIFDPATTLGRSVDANRDNVYHFTTIDIPTGTTVKLTQIILGGPVTWLASGAVNISGTIDLSGENGVGANTAGVRVPSLPGAGGFHGGQGGGGSSGRLASPGLGPAGGSGSVANGTNALGGGNTANRFLVPLVGGSGGGGGLGAAANRVGGAGGAGGGAILIASSDSITVNSQGIINARGGDGGALISDGREMGGGGAGGSIRLVAPGVLGSGSLNVNGGPGGGGATNGSAGNVRIEAFQRSTALNISGVTPFVSTPFDTFVTTQALPTLRVITVGGVPVVANPTGSFELPDVTVNSATSIPVVVEARQIPLDAMMRLTVFPEDGPDITVEVPNRTGDLNLSTATVPVQFPTGFSRGFVRATFNSQQ